MSMHNISAVEKLSSYHPRVTKRITDIFRSSEMGILIEGAPGIGKTVLAKEIAYCWANGEILADMKLLILLFIRDPDLHCVNSLNELVHYLNNDYLSDSEVEVAVDELRKSKGSGIVFVFDGYDECPYDSKLKGFIDKLVERDSLPMCMIVITSRPTASLSLRHLVNQRIEILGLANKEQDQYISESLKESPEMKIKLQEYLKQQPVISSLIYVPLHLTILLYLFKQGSLPETLTEMNELFVMHTIYRHLTKQRQLSYMKIDKITDLPEPELTIVYQLSKLAYKGLCNSQLVFTYDEMKEACPKVDDIPGAINGFSLLQTVERYHQKGAGKFPSVNFIHFTMQEYLAALHVSTLPSDRQSSLIGAKFWDRQFNFMWIMYVGIVGPQSTIFTTNVINNLVNERKHSQRGGEYNILARKCLFIFQCFLEGKDVKLTPKVITDIFSDGNINLSKVSLLPHHIMSLTVFMMRSATQWKSLNLDSCSIGCNGMSILTKFFVDFKERIVTIKHLNLRNNNLTSLRGIDTITDQDHVDVISGLQSIEYLDISLNSLCDREIIRINEFLKSNHTLCKLNLSNNKIPIKGANKLAEAIQVNTALQELNISNNKITDEGTKILAEAIKVNTTLQELNISKNWISKEGVMRIVEACTKNRTLHKLVCTHNNLSKSGLAAINEYIRKENAVQIFDASWNSIASKDSKLAIKTTFKLIDVQQKLQSDNDSIQEELWFIDEITELKYVKEFLHCCLDDVQHVNLANTTMTDLQMVAFCDCLMVNSTVTELNLSNNNITGEGTKMFAKSIQINTTLQELYMSDNNITDEETKILAKGIQINATLQKINISINKITNEGTRTLAEAIKINTTLQELNISKNWISKEGVMRIVEACTEHRTLHKLVCTHNNLSKSGLAAINEYIRKENAVQIFDASWNSIVSNGNWIKHLPIKTTFQLLDVQQELQLDDDSIQEELWFIDEVTELKYVKEFIHCCLDVHHVNLANTIMTDFQMVTFCDCLMVNSTVTELDLSNNYITDERTERLAKSIQINTTLQELNISNNNITDEGTKILTKGIQINAALQKINISVNKITDEGTKILAEAIKVNTTLQELNISKNWISKEGVMRIVEACTKNRTLRKLVCTYNNLSKSGLATINEYIRKENAVQIFDASWNSIIASSRCGLQLVITTVQSLRRSPDDWNSLDYDKQVWLIVNGVWNTIEYCIIVHDSLMQLNFQSCNVEFDLPIDIIQGVIQVNTLQKLNISNCKIFDEKAIAFSECFKTNTTLKELVMSKNYVACNGACAIAESIQVNAVLQRLNISHNVIPDDGAIAFGRCLKTNTTLIELDMSRNNITSNGASAIAEAIQANTALQILNVSYNKISNNGGIAFSECLRTNTTLIELDMSGNDITCKGASAIAKAIQVNTALQRLNISHNKIFNNGGITFSVCLKTNRTLKELDMSGNYISSEILKSIAQAIQENKTVHKHCCIM